MLQPKRLHVLKPLPRSHPGYVYSKKMTLGCKPSLSSRKVRASKIRAGVAGAKGGGQPAVRSMLPWWDHSASMIGAGSQRADAMSQQKETGHDADAALYNTPRSAIDVEAQSPEQGSTRSATPEATPNNLVEEHHRRGSSDGGSCTLNPQAVRKLIAVEKAENEEKQRANEYTHYSNLFENPPPSIPTVDQYIFDDNILYEAITKRGNRKALPVNPSGGGVIGIQECGDAPWAAADRANSGVDESEAYVDPQDLLYADEDIDKVPDR